MKKICLIIVDGLRFDTATDECGYLMAEVEASNAQLWKMHSCLPTISAPLYETIHTGIPPVDHGITSNEALRASNQPNVFSVVKANNRISGAVAHSYFHTLYGESAFDPFKHTEINQPGAAVSHARYYSMEGYSKANPTMPSEIDLCAQTWLIAENHQPDYLLLHSSSCDTLGHYYTADSAEYRTQAWRVDNALSQLIPKLVSLSYAVLVTADHGMNADGHHGGDQNTLREVPLVAFNIKLDRNPNDLLPQTAIAPTILSYLELDIPPTMKEHPLNRSPKENP